MPKQPDKRRAPDRPPRWQEEPDLIELKTGDISDVPDFVDADSFAEGFEPTPLPADLAELAERADREAALRAVERLLDTPPRTPSASQADREAARRAAEDLLDPTPPPAPRTALTRRRKRRPTARSQPTPPREPAPPPPDLAAFDDPTPAPRDRESFDDLTQPPRDLGSFHDAAWAPRDRESFDQRQAPPPTSSQPTRILTRDSERAVPTAIIGSERLEAASPTSEVEVPDDERTAPRPHPAPAGPDEETALRARLSPPVGRIKEPTDPMGSQRPDDAQADRPPPPVSGPASVLEPAFLIVSKGPGAGRSVPLPEGELTLGRSSSCGLKLDHPSISRHHASVVRQSERFFLRDPGSHNGTFVNGRRARGQVELRSGDEVGLGKVTLVFRWGGLDTGPLTSTAFFAPALDRPAVKLAVFAAAVAVGTGAVFLLWNLGGFPEERPAEPIESGSLRLAGPAALKAAPGPLPAEPLPVPEPAPTHEPPAAREELSLMTEPSAAKVFSEARAAGAPPVAEMELPKRFAEKQPIRPPAPRAEKRPAAKRPAPAPAPRTGSDTEALALYEAGEVDAAIRAARAAGNPKLAGRIGDFKKRYAAARADLSFKDGAGAIKNFTAALAIDDELSGGWGKTGGEIRVELAGLFQLAGSQALAAGDDVKASALFERALKYDPANEKAKAGLRQARATSGND